MTTLTGAALEPVFAEATPAEVDGAARAAEAETALSRPRLEGERARTANPVTVAVRCASRDELLASARRLRGHLTATVHATERDLAAYGALLPILARKAGRVVLNGVPTGVEVTHAMHHGGPWPATTDPRATSVGTAAILRFARPVSFQDVPDGALPDELRDANPRGIWRLVDGQLTKDAR